MESNRPYISYSQYALFKSSPKAYYEKYGLNKESYGTKYQQFGKQVMQDLEFEDMKGVPKELKQLSKEGVVEFELTVKSRFIEKELFGIIDICSDDMNKFYEIKTGKHAWDEAKVLDDEQMLFYALMINLKYKVIPSATLVWVETKECGDGEVVFTGNVKTFKREFTLDEIVAFQSKVMRASMDISDYEHSVLDIENDIDARLLKAMADKKRADEELDLIKSEIMLELKEFSNKYADSENFKITLAKRKTHTYSEQLTEKISKQNAEIKLAKKQEEKDGITKIKETEYLLIKTKK